LIVVAVDRLPNEEEVFPPFPARSGEPSEESSIETVGRVKPQASHVEFLDPVHHGFKQIILYLRVAGIELDEIAVTGPRVVEKGKPSPVYSIRVIPGDPVTKRSGASPSGKVLNKGMGSADMCENGVQNE
jgi:hypothetical protein